MIVEFEHLVGQPVEQVFALMADIERRPEWVTPALERTKLTDGPVGVGSRYQAKDRYPGRRAEFFQEITAYEPRHLLHESWGGPMAGKMATRFVEDNGSTKLIIRTEINTSGLPKLVAPLMKGWLIRAFRKDFARFRQIIAAES